MVGSTTFTLVEASRAHLSRLAASRLLAYARSSTLDGRNTELSARSCAGAGDLLLVH